MLVGQRTQNRTWGEFTVADDQSKQANIGPIFKRKLSQEGAQNVLVCPIVDSKACGVSDLDGSPLSKAII